MPDISEYYSGSSGSALKAHDIDGDELIVVCEGVRFHKFDGDAYPTAFMQLADMDKEFRVNKTNFSRIKEMYGSNTDDWIGKEFTLMPDKTKGPKGDIVDTIVVRVRKTARNAPNPNPKKYDERNPPPPLDDEIGF